MSAIINPITRILCVLCRRVRARAYILLELICVICDILQSDCKWPTMQRSSEKHSLDITFAIFFSNSLCGSFCNCSQNDIRASHASVAVSDDFSPN